MAVLPVKDRRVGLGLVRKQLGRDLIGILEAGVEHLLRPLRAEEVRDVGLAGEHSLLPGVPVIGEHCGFLDQDTHWFCHFL